MGRQSLPCVVLAVEKFIESASNVKRRSWIDSCPPDMQGDFLVIKERWKANAYSATRSVVIRAIATIAEERLGKRPSDDTVRRWLERN